MVGRLPRRRSLRSASTPLAGGDDRLDELPVGIVVALLDQLGHRPLAIRRLVVDAGEIERADRIVVGPDDEDAGELRAAAAAHASSNAAVSTDADELADARARSRPAGARMPCGAAGGGAGLTRITCSTPTAATPRPGGVASSGRSHTAMAFAAPVAVGRELHSAAARSRPAAAARPGGSPTTSSRCGPVKSTISASRGPHAGAPRLEAPRAPRRAARRRPGRGARRGRARATSTSRNPGWPKLSVSTSTYRRPISVAGGRRLVRRAAHELPQRVDERGAPARRRSSGDPSSRHQNAPRTRRRRPLLTRAPARPRRPARRRRPARASTTARGTIVGSDRRIEQQLDRPSIRRRPAEPSIVVRLTSAATTLARVDERAARSRIRSGDSSSADGRQQAPAGHAQRRPPAVGPARAGGSVHGPAGPRGARRRRSRAQSAVATPAPCAATTSILTPASVSARSTPAWYAPAVPVPHRTTPVRSRGEYAASVTSTSSSSWIVTSLRISNSRAPPGVGAVDFVALFLADERAADRRGDRDQPASGSASSGMTSS